MEATIVISGDDFAAFGVEELSVLDVNDAVALPELGASHSNWLCCSSSSSSSCC
ncbi:thiazolylpeptide-type bacteriocin [Kitasatospora sp. NPDC089797]|uniref:thiazolylpeptide-type bacteriocin n=1 Tax=unclassified Kitasatospora TaxID=2633591 RepID=UPI0018CB4AC8|nr:thiazolylpeptide-type bacteriocin [Kitasatospora sp. SUK 42]MBV2153693.1 thiazolylpeptide-type bacteriocin [Kitasatospora sp. SUK 42]